MARRSTPTIREAGELYAAQMFRQGGSAATRRGHLSITRRLSTFTNDRQVGTVTPELIELFFYGPSGLSEGCSSTTLANYRAYLKGFLEWCYRRKWCDEPGYLLGGLRDTSTSSNRVRLRLSEDQMWRMVDSARDARDRALMCFAMHTALRISEITRIRLREWNRETGEMLVHISKTGRNPETDIVKVAPALDAELRAWLTIYTELENPGPDDYLFPARTRAKFVGVKRAADAARGYVPNAPISKPGIQFRKMAEDAGIEVEDGDGWHTVRRSSARLFFDRCSQYGHDAALRMTSAFLHHKNTTTTERYLGLQLEKAKRDAMMAEGFLSRPVTDNVVRLDRRVSDG